MVDGLVDRWLGAGVRRTLAAVDGSFSWLIERYQDRPVAGPTARRGAGKVHRYTPRWQAGAVASPSMQAVILRGPDEERLARLIIPALQVDGAPRGRGPALLLYRADNHGKLTEAAQSGGLTVYLTAHAVAVRDDRRKLWSWAYLGTDQWKLRFATIKAALTDGRLVAVERWVQDEGDFESKREAVLIDPIAGLYVTRRLRVGERLSLDEATAHQLDEARTRD